MHDGVYASSEHRNVLCKAAAGSTLNNHTSETESSQTSYNPCAHGPLKSSQRINRSINYPTKVKMKNQRASGRHELQVITDTATKKGHTATTVTATGRLR